MKKNRQIRKKFIDKNEKKDIILGGKGKEYSAVSRELEQTFFAWLAFADVEECEFSQRINALQLNIEKFENHAGEVEINIMAGHERVIAPLVHIPSDEENYDRFIVNALLLLQYVASRYDNKALRQAIDLFTRKMYEENEFLRDNIF